MAKAKRTLDAQTLVDLNDLDGVELYELSSRLAKQCPNGCCSVRPKWGNAMTVGAAEAIIDIGGEGRFRWRELEEAVRWLEMWGLKETEKLARRGRSVMRQTIEWERERLITHGTRVIHPLAPQKKLSKPMRQALDLLSGRGWVPYTEILKALDITSASLSRLVARLEERELVHRRGTGRSLEVAMRDSHEDPMFAGAQIAVESWETVNEP